MDPVGDFLLQYGSAASFQDILSLSAGLAAAPPSVVPEVSLSEYATQPPPTTTSPSTASVPPADAIPDDGLPPAPASSASSSSQPKAMDKGRGKGKDELLAYYAAERREALENDIPWSARGPEGPLKGGPKRWRGQTFRESSQRWASRAGARNRFWSYVHFLQSQGHTPAEARRLADLRFARAPH
jgi:hypothetical protein